MTTPAPKPGIYENIPFLDYRKWPCVSQSELKMLRRSPGHLDHYRKKKSDKQTPSMKLGSAVDCLWFDGQKAFDAGYTVVPPPEEQTLKADGTPYKNWLVSVDGKDWKADQVEAGRDILSADDYASVVGMAASLNAHPIAAPFRARSNPQVSIVWIHEPSGVLCKGRFDMLAGDEPPFDPGDLKSVNGVMTQLDPMSEYDPFKRHAGRLGYDLQAGHYCNGLDTLTGVPHERFDLFVVEQALPCTAEHYFYEKEDINEAQEILDDLLFLYKECNEVGEWRTSTNGSYPLSVPRYTRR